LTYIMGVSKEIVTEILTRLGYAATVAQTTLINDLNTDPAKFSLVSDLITKDKLMDMNFLGMNLGIIPTIKPALLFGADTIGTYLPIFFLPILSVGLVILSQYMTEQATKKRMPAKKKAVPNATDAPDISSQMNKTMKFMMPAMTLWIGFTLPSSMSLYWIFTYALQIGQQLLIEYLRKKADQKKAAELERTGKTEDEPDQQVIEGSFEVKDDNKETKNK